MDDKITFEEILYSKDNFPRMLKKGEGELLKKYFELDIKFHGRDEEKANIERRYIKIIDGKRFSLLEEFLFKENETSLDINRAIGVNYYLSRKEL